MALIAEHPRHHSPQASPSAAALDLRGLWFRYGEIPVLRGVDVRIEPGEINALLGPNGSGKSTLVSIVAGLRVATSGSVHVCGHDVVRQRAEARAHIGLAAQEPGIYPTLTIAENLLLFCELAGLRGRTRSARIAEVLDGLALASLADRRVSELSGGQKRRVHVAAALVHRPSLLLLDEPTAGVDVETRSSMLELIGGLRDEGVAVCYATHYLQEVERLGAGVTILDRGSVLASASVAELISAHGAATVELTFEGPAPEWPRDASVSAEGSTLRMRGARPEAMAAEAIASLGESARRLRSVEIVPPSLDAVYLTITGRRYQSDDAGFVGPRDDSAPPAHRALDRTRPTSREGFWRGGFSVRRALALARHGLRLYRRDMTWVLLVLAMPIGIAAFLAPALREVLSVAGVGGATGAEQVFPGMAVLFGLFLSSAIPIAMFSEHGWRTWDRLRASRATTPELVAGKVVPPLLLLLTQFGVLFAAGVLVFGFGVDGNPWAFAGVMIALSFAVMGLGLLLAAVCRTSLQANAVGNLVSIGCAGVGGAFVPAMFLPGWAAALGPFTPSYWAMRGSNAVTLAPGGWSEVALPIAVLIGFAGTFSIVGLALLNVDVRKEGST